MRKFGNSPSVTILNSMIILCKYAPTPQQGLEKAQEMIEIMRKRGLQPTVTTLNNMLRVMIATGLNSRKDLEAFAMEMMRTEAVQPNATTKQLVDQGTL